MNRKSVHSKLTAEATTLFVLTFNFLNGLFSSFLSTLNCFTRELLLISRRRGLNQVFFVHVMDSQITACKKTLGIKEREILESKLLREVKMLLNR